MLALLLIVLMAPVLSLPEADRATYRVDQASRFVVHTGTAGLFGAFGDEHTVRARTFSGRIEYDPDRPAASSVRLTVRTTDLEILTDVDASDRREIREAMESEVLRVDGYPEIRFVSERVVPTGAGVRVVGYLTIRGVTNRESMDMTLETRADTLYAEGAFAVLQTDYGIEPYESLGGTIQVSDRITFRIDAVAVRE